MPLIKQKYESLDQMVHAGDFLDTGSFHSYMNIEETSLRSFSIIETKKTRLTVDYIFFSRLCCLLFFLFYHSTFVGSAWSFIPMTSDFEGFQYHISSITLFSYLNS